MQFKEGVLLKKFTTLGVGGEARHFVDVTTLKAVKDALEWAKTNSLNVFILGSGSNLLVSDTGFDGLVIKVGIMGIDVLSEDDNSVTYKVGAGENWDDFVAHIVDRNLGGIECLSGIPGLIGASPIQNIGAYGQEVKDTVVLVEAINLNTLYVKKFDTVACQFSYRNSIFKQSKDWLVTHVHFKLRKNPVPAVNHDSLREAFSDHQPTLKGVRDKVLEIRRSKSMVYDENDVNSHSTGSFFVNPIVTAEKAASLLQKYPEMPNWKLDTNETKLPAAWLIEKAGFSKGLAHKTAGLSEKHTLAMVNMGEATASDIYDFALAITEKVEEVFGVVLELEAVLVGKFKKK